jgi:hypothetical protein
MKSAPMQRKRHYAAPSEQNGQYVPVGVQLARLNTHPQRLLPCLLPPPRLALCLALVWCRGVIPLDGCNIIMLCEAADSQVGSLRAFALALEAWGRFLLSPHGPAWPCIVRRRRLQRDLCPSMLVDSLTPPRCLKPKEQIGQSSSPLLFAFPLMPSCFNCNLASPIPSPSPLRDGRASPRGSAEWITWFLSRS